MILPADEYGPAGNHRPADNHVHSQWSHDTGPRASMAVACARAVELGLPAVAFTEHLDFTEWGPGDPISATGITPNDQWGPRPFDVQRLSLVRGRVPAPLPFVADLVWCGSR